MLGKLKKNMGFSLVIFAFFFLFEPRTALIDPLPDIIGYFILCSALINLADINDRIKTAFNAFRKAAFLSAARIICKIVLEKVFVENEQTVGLLLFVFIFAVFELWILIPGYKSLFEGLLSLGMFEGGEAMYRKKKEDGKNITEKTYALTLIFLIVKNLLECIPEFSTLENDTSHEFINIMRFLSCVLIIPISVFWLVRIIIYFTDIKKDLPFISALEEKFKKKAEANPQFFFYRTLIVGLYIMIIAFILTLNIYSDGLNILPNIFAYCTLLLAAFFLRSYSDKWKPVFSLSLLGALSSLSVYISEKQFFERYTPEMVNRNLEAYESFYFMLSLYILQSVIFIISVIAVTVFLKSIHKSNIINNSEHEMYIKESKRGMSLRVSLTVLSGVLYALASIYRIISHTLNKDIWIFNYSSAISVVFDLIFTASSFALVSFMIGEIKQNNNMSL